MKCNTVQDKLIDYLENSLNQSEQNKIESHIDTCIDCQEELKITQQFLNGFDNTIEEEPSIRLKANFDTFLTNEIEKEATKVIPLDNKKQGFPFLRVAASIALVVSSFLLGKYQNNANTQTQQATTLTVNENKVLALLENQSASQRILAINNSEDLNTNSTAIIDAIIKRLYNDENTNVRLAAAEALAKFSSLEQVKLALIKALETEKEATVQIELIQILASIQEKRALTPMKQMLENESTPTYVKQQIQYNLASLL